MIPCIRVQEQAKVVFGNRNQKWLFGCGKLERKGHVGNLRAVEMFSVLRNHYTGLHNCQNCLITLRSVHFIMLIIIPHLKNLLSFQDSDSYSI